MAAKYVVATFSTWCSPTVHINAGEIWAGDDPVVQSHPDWFTDDPELFARRTAPKKEDVQDSLKKHEQSQTEQDTPTRTAQLTEKPVEQATASPGEKRTTQRGNK